MGLDIFLDDDGGFFVLVFFLVIKQSINLLVPDNSIDHDSLENSLFSGIGGRFGVQAGLQLG
jgi:hypothetical protein